MPPDGDSAAQAGNNSSDFVSCVCLVPAKAHAANFVSQGAQTLQVRFPPLRAPMTKCLSLCIGCSRTPRIIQLCDGAPPAIVSSCSRYGAVLAVVGEFMVLTFPRAERKVYKDDPTQAFQTQQLCQLCAAAQQVRLSQSQTHRGERRRSLWERRRSCPLTLWGATLNLTPARPGMGVQAPGIQGGPQREPGQHPEKGPGAAETGADRGCVPRHAADRRPERIPRGDAAPDPGTAGAVL